MINFLQPAIFMQRRTYIIQGDTKKTGTFEKPNKFEEIQEKKLLTDIEPLQLVF